MAKKRKSIFEASTSQTEINQAAKNVQKKTIDDIPVKKDKLPPKKEKNEKLMHLYVDTMHHRQAKIGATMRGMKLGEYIEWLIDQDKERL
ncbi:MAG: hypothetical protein AAFZ15_24855 [Bacteroidota bacterium]